MDLRAKKSSSEDTMSKNDMKFCSDCKTSKTPLWRGGPAGPKSLCNACGIRYRKKRRAMLGMNKGVETKEKEKKKKKKKERSDSSHSSYIATSNDDDGNKKKLKGNFNGVGEDVKMRLYALGSEVLLQSGSSLSGVVKKQRCQRRRKLGEEEQAAISLMALSCGSVFA